MKMSYRKYSIAPHIIFIALVFACSLIVKPDPSQQGAVRLFDGSTFTGWEGNLKVFRIEDGAIVGGTMKDAMPRNEFLCTTKQYSDFVLRLKFKLLGDPAKANAGVQFRSHRIPNHHEVIGYQADMGQNYWGALYDESRRRKVLAGPEPEAVSKFLRRDQWNEYEIRAEGNHVRLAVNGYQTADYTETDEKINQAGQTGYICLQVHAGPPSEAWYKDITIELLPNKK